MAILRKETRENYTIIDNSIFKNKNLSLKAKGLLCTMLSLPDDWKFSEEGLVALSNDGKTAVRTSIKELIDNGYLTRSRARNDKGNFSDTIYTVYENPILENPILEFPILENEHNKIINILNTKELNTKEYITPIYPLKENFEKFWQSYPKKQNKSKTENWFEKNKPNEELMNLILEKLELFKKTKEWKKNNGQFIPMPTTWLNGKRWEDEINEDNIEMTDEEMVAEVERQLREEGFYDNR